MGDQVMRGMLPAAQIDLPLIYDPVVVDDVDSFVIGHRRIDVSRDESDTITHPNRRRTLPADGRWQIVALCPTRRESHVLV